MDKVSVYYTSLVAQFHCTVIKTIYFVTVFVKFHGMKLLFPAPHFS